MSDRVSNTEEREWARLYKLWLRGASAQLLDAVREYLSKYPQQPAPWIVLATCLRDFARYREALAALRTAERVMEPSRRHYVWFQRGWLFREKGNYKVAQEWYERAIAAQPKNATYHIMLGSLLATRGDFDSAKKSHRRAARLGTGATDEAYLNLALIMRAEGRYRQALQYLHKALEIDPGYAEAKVAARDIEKALKSRGSAKKTKRTGGVSRRR